MPEAHETDIARTEDLATRTSEQADLQALREALYLGPGYAVVRGFLEPSQVRHVVSFWDSHANPLVPRFDKRRQMAEGVADFSVRTPSLDTHFNFFWNRPLDMFSYVTSWRLQTLRNRIEGSTPNKDFLPHFYRNRVDTRARYGASYRIATTREGGAIPVHRDHPLDHSRIQLSLLLSDYGDDYEGGFLLADMAGGSPRNLSRDEELRAGDLLLFRYYQPHGVEAVTTPAGARGFARILMPLQELPVPVPRRAPARRALDWLRSTLRAPRPAPAAPPGSDEEAYRGSERRYYDEEVETLMRIAVREGVPPAEVYYHRGLWARYRLFDDWPFEILKKHGLRPEHHVLDVGCGFLRLGMKLVPWLDDDHYCGVDPVPAYLRAGQAYLDEIVRSDRSARLACTAGFDYTGFDRRFDYAMAHSVFTHLSTQQIRQAFSGLKEVMAAGGQLFFTIVLGRDVEEEIVYVGDTPVTLTQHRDMGFYDGLARELQITIEHLRDERHPTQAVCRAIF